GKDMGQIAMAAITGEGSSGSEPVSDTPHAVMAYASDRGRDYAEDRAATASAETARSQSVVAFNAGDPMSGGVRPYSGMSDRASDPFWDRIAPMSGATTTVAAATSPVRPDGAKQTTAAAPRDAAAKTASADPNAANAAPQNTLRTAGLP